MQRPGWYDLQGAGSAPRDKRCLDASEGDDLHPEAKRPKVPALASVIVEALKVDSLQKICSSLEPILRRVEVFLGNINIIPNLNFQANFAMFMIDVSEEVERALAKLGPPRVGGRSSPKRIEGPDGRNLQLQFRTRLSPHIFTGGKVEGEQGAPIHVVLLDVNSGHVVSSGTESSAKLDVLVLQGDFNNEDDENWTEEEFESHVVKEREGKRPLLTGDLQVSLKDGVGTLGELTFTDNSSWIRSRKFRLGLKIASGYCEGVRIREAKSEAFTVKDHRGELYKKHYPPALKDEVWRLEKIGKDGSFHKRLNKCGIHTVEDFLRLVVRDPQRLRNILGSGMSNKMWEILVEHAKTCVLSGKYYIYYSDETRNVGAIFNNIYEFSGLIASGQFYSADDLNDSQKAFADTLVKKAYDNWSHAIEYDGRALLNFTNNKKAVGSQKDTTLTSDYPSSYDEHVSQLHSQDSAPVEEHVVETEEEAGGGTIYNSNQTARYSNLIHDVDSSARLPIGSTSFAPENQLVVSAHQTQITRNDSTGLALAPPQQANLEYHSSGPSVQHQDLGTFDDWSRQRDNRSIDDFFSEDEIRMRSNEMLENDDMQHLLRVFTMGGTSTSLHDDGFGFSSYVHSPCPNFNFDDDRNRGSGKAVIGWLKIKAAMRWGIFVRKRAAERRAAQLVELDD